MKKILEVFRTYCDAYLEFLNNFISGSRFCEWYELDETEFQNLLKAVEEVKKYNGRYCEIDYYYNAITNSEYTEKEAIYND